jgi:hypothetical protein
MMLAKSTRAGRSANPLKPLLPDRFMAYLDAAIVLLCGVVLVRTAMELLQSANGERDEAGRQAAREYDRGVQEFGGSGTVEAKAQEAKYAVEGSEAETMKQAERAGKERSKGDDPAGKR